MRRPPPFGWNGGLALVRRLRLLAKPPRPQPLEARAKAARAAVRDARRLGVDCETARQQVEDLLGQLDRGQVGEFIARSLELPSEAAESGQEITSIVSTRFGTDTLLLGWLDVLRLRRANLKVATPILVARRVQFRNPGQVLMASGIVLREGVVLSGRSRHVHGITLCDSVYLKEGVYMDAYGGLIEVGHDCAFGQGVAIHGHGGVRIGAYCMIGAGARIVSSNHNYHGCRLPFMLQGTRERGIVIGDNVWIGAGVHILDGSSIGDDCVIGAGAVVQGEVPPGSRALGSRVLEITKIRGLEPE